MTKPKLGQTVYVTVDPEDNQGSPIAVAQIVRIYSDSEVSVRVFHETSVPSVVGGIQHIPFYPTQAEAVDAITEVITRYAKEHDGNLPPLKHIHYVFAELTPEDLPAEPAKKAGARKPEKEETPV